MQTLNVFACRAPVSIRVALRVFCFNDLGKTQACSFSACLATAHRDCGVVAVELWRTKRGLVAYRSLTAAWRLSSRKTQRTRWWKSLPTRRRLHFCGRICLPACSKASGATPISAPMLCARINRAGMNHPRPLRMSAGDQIRSTYTL